MNEPQVRLSDDELKAVAEDADALSDPYRGHTLERQDDGGDSHAQHR